MKPVTQVLPRSLLLAAMLLPIGCSPGPSQMREQVVFSVATGFGQGMRHVTPVDVVDVGVPALHNLTGRSVRVRKVSLVSAPAAVRLLSVTAHPGVADLAADLAAPFQHGGGVRLQAGHRAGQGRVTRRGLGA